ncbi:FAD-dependent oxidoreductase [Methylocapsa palsarum]|uniref:Flavin containing amine oxidoreductase n=1 Tax=Methylocapsa palsarum TaxID=1612308 RepID=A0A1I4ADM8_9HYPH|nr:FAD-dependent oxidoreductase [Methylocapsa palsarum]SFK54290.1 Flavin containing amine oxidoreductase [Methylocapsa palsarum]
MARTPTSAGGRAFSAISRRDFLNGALIASSGLAGPSSLEAAAAGEYANACDGEIGRDPRALRSGNLPSAFNVAHWLRDERLRFEPGRVSLAAGCDGHEGRFEISEAGDYDVVIVGGGLSGLSAAFYILRRRPETRILLIDANAHLGGNAARDQGPPLPVTASTGGAYCVAPYADFQKELYGGLGVEWEAFRIASPMYSYFFDAETPGVKAGRRGWNIDTYGEGLKDVPYAAPVVEDLLRCRTAFKAWSDVEGAPTDPADASSPAYDYLSEMTLDAYLRDVLHCDPLVSDFYTRYAIDAIGGPASLVNAHTSISFLNAEYGDLFTFPGGTSELAKRLARWLTDPEQGRHPVAIRLNAVALRADQGAPAGNAKPAVVYVENMRFLRATASAVILACQSHAARRLTAHMSDASRIKAWSALNTAPAIVANVGISSASSLADLGLGYNQYWWGSRDWASFIVADWAGRGADQPDRPTVLTVFGGNTAPPEDFAKERLRLLRTPFSAYETSLKEDLSRILGGAKFDFERDVTSISLYRWGHGMILPTTTSVFGDSHDANGRLDRARAPRRIAFAPLGRISFAGQDSEGAPSVECALSSGLRAANEALENL